MTTTQIHRKLRMPLREWCRLNNIPYRSMTAELSRWRKRTTGFPGGKGAVRLIELSKAVGGPVIPALREYFNYLQE